jgi:hypothetical protein
MNQNMTTAEQKALFTFVLLLSSIFTGPLFTLMLIKG